MSINFPSSLDSLSNPTSTDLLDNTSPSLDHWTQHADANDAIEALEAKVGVNGSAVTTSHDYKLSEVTSTDKAVGKTATQTLTNKTLTSPTINTATITGSALTTSTVNGVTLDNTQGTTKFLRGDGSYASPTAGDASYAAKGSVQGLTDAATSGLTITTGVISVNSGTSANNIVKLDGSAKLPAVDGSQLTNLPPTVTYQEMQYEAYLSDAYPASTFRTTSETDGSVMYACNVNSNSSVQINVYRFVRDSITGMFYVSHKMSYNAPNSISNSNAVSISVAGSYVYVSYHHNLATAAIVRFAKADLTGATSITISGSNFTSSCLSAFSDGSNLYVLSSSATYKKYSISGTTATYVSDITYTSSGTPYGAFCDGTNVWILGGSKNLLKYALAGGSATTSLTPTNYFSIYTSTGTGVLFCPRTGYLAVGFTFPNTGVSYYLDWTAFRQI